jgi:obg-like ATPase 1
MPPKKKEEEKPRALLGRPGNNVKAGLVGLPNVGKSTTFNMMCKMSVPAENFPFCTIDPTESRVQVPDPQFTELIGTFKPKSEVPAVLTVFDIAGLVKGASEGAGLGNAFLSHISATDALFHICRTYEETADGDVATHVEDSVDPVRDLEIIANELLQKDIAFVESQRGPLAKEVGRDGKAKDKKDKLAATDKILEWIKSGKDARFGQWSSKEVDVLNEYNLLTSKPALYLVNMSEKDFLRKKNKHLPKLHAWLTENRPGEKMIPYSAAMEAKLLEMEAAEKAAFLEESKAASQMDKIVVEGYHTLQLIHFYTCGADEVKCWTIRKGWKAPQAAGTIHTDFERGFIKAEVYSYADWKSLGGVDKVKEAGKDRTEGKEYVVNDGDIIFFKFNVTAEGKKK